jgi:tRNA-Thr(GGU) m(6)t(6)A37 methyltransferase TsaA
MMTIQYQPIGVIHSPFKRLEGMPVQPPGAAGIVGSVGVYPEYRDGLADLDGFSHIILLYAFHGREGFELKVVPFLDTVPRGLFATRAPARPNPIGLSVVKLTRVEGATLHIENVDILDGTPLLDIKPYVPDFDEASHVRLGWLEAVRKRVQTRRADGRFRDVKDAQAEDSQD